VPLPYYPIPGSRSCPAFFGALLGSLPPGLIANFKPLIAKSLCCVRQVRAGPVGLRACTSNR
jgi:hypothetical protein